MSQKGANATSSTLDRSSAAEQNKSVIWEYMESFRPLNSFTKVNGLQGTGESRHHIHELKQLTHRFRDESSLDIKRCIDSRLYLRTSLQLITLPSW